MASHRRPSQPGSSSPVRATVLTAAAATVVAALAAAPAGADPGVSRAEVKSRVDALYEQAERSTERFNGAEERTEALREQVETLRDRTARGQERINRMRGGIGTLAAAQYRSGGMDPTVQLMFSERPEGYLDKAAALDRVTAVQAARLGELQHALRVLDQQRHETAGRLAELEKSRRAVERHRRVVQSKLAAARRLLNSLPQQDRGAHDRASREQNPASVPEVGGGPVAPSGRAAAAVRAVRAAVGLPYAWGQSGPSSFDCSGLTQWAYRTAGVSIPRTSQAQGQGGRRVPLDQARPGDLVVYRDDASHVGMYVGGGQVVHAPYPGARVRYDPVGMMPISAVTRY